MIKHVRVAARTLAALVLIGPISCIGALGVNLFPDSKDIELGRQIDEEIRKAPQEYPILSGYPEVKAYIESIGRKILASPSIEKRSLYAYRFEIIRDDSTINAFCTPGGYIYVYTGLLKFLDNEATLAGVIAHEIGHAERRHSTRRMSSIMGVQAILAIALGEKPGELAEVTGNLFAGLGLLVNSRSDENESDTYSIKYLQATEYYAGAIRFFFEKVSRGREAGKGNSLERMLSTHPLPQERMENVEKIMSQIGNPQAVESNLFAERFKAFKQGLP